MNESLKKWAKEATILPPEKRPVRLESNPILTCFTVSSFAVPTKAIRRIERIGDRGRYL
ncbi:hypothetical protein SAMN02745165_01185 [Malonomonas rubra DSM 5091]|uniref:Uncharacterized protein n=1 Tax=Malonomonas rubra DSM 5091 TaxID=1122189 RepID=A0A1M6F839_MALRU|nr:hypothetical protein [Malonomonas rubra]SHI93811.1 hypothetical protein SAMN02745165_01185 [Malonomonas rubra DSM 5091]